ncbi:hypothetical protein NCER_100697 [Vairimorpha ceranae BRL01]|uniref:Protein transport protein SEC31 n=1 Tax=Vairimorpha ceranae (strain BRL01) TaxID=578460 RepID=C4V888_VAIC1|nr:hypothetical protein NCER_100697 [Vairimorpha ceranae BRL01]
MIFNKSYLTTFSKNKPFLALASKGKIIDSKFTLSSELSLYDYSEDIHYSPLQTDSEYCKLEWCEKENFQILACGHTNGSISLYEPNLDGKSSNDESFRLVKSFEGLNGKVLGIDYNSNKNVIAAGSAKGNIIFWNLDKIDQQYKCDIPITENITSLAWNTKVSRILCAGTECGKILILDIRAKNVAMTLQNKDIKIINNVKWHPKCSTTIFASTNLPYLACFKLDSNSMTQVGKFESSTISFNSLNENTIVCYSDNQADYIDVDTLTVKESLKVENVFDVSFSQKDPIYCCSYNTGTTEIFSKMLSRNEGNCQVQLDNYIVGKNIYKIRREKLEFKENDNAESKIFDILYAGKNFNFNKETRKTLGNFLLDNASMLFNVKLEKTQSEIKFDLTDKVILTLIKNEITTKEDIFDGRTVSLNFLFQLLLKNEEIEISDPLYFLLNIIINKNYTNFWKSISSDQWPIMIAILIFSDLSDEEVLTRIKEIQNDLQIPILNLLINEPQLYFNTRETVTDLPKNIFEILPFFQRYGSELIVLKKLNLQYNNPLLNEYFWFAKNYGMYNDLKDVNFEDKIIKTYINGGEFNEKKIIDKLENVSIKASDFVNKTVTEPSNQSLFKNAPKPSLYSSGANKSVTGFSTKPMPKTDSQENATAVTNNKPLPSKKSLYSGVLNRSMTNFSSKPGTPVSTYGQQRTIQTQPNTSFAKNKPDVIPTPFNRPNLSSTLSNPASKNGSFPIPTPSMQSKSSVYTPKSSSQDVTSPVLPSTQKTETAASSTYDVVAISKNLEEVFENLKQTASKKNNLIVGNKIKDAVRRFAIFQQSNKNELSLPLVEIITKILDVINSEVDKTMLKHKVRSLIEDANDVKNLQSDIWLPAIGILVQLVY